MDQATTVSRLLTLLGCLESKCKMDSVIELFPDMTWSDVVLAIDELSRSGDLILTRDEKREYWVQPAHVPAQAQPCEDVQLIADVLAP